MNMVYYIYLYFILIRIKTISTKNKNLYKINKFSKINNKYNDLNKYIRLIYIYN